MNIKELKSLIIKKKLSADSVCYRWHNKNNSGGNFCIKIWGVNGRNYEISGDYDSEGTLMNLRFGFLFQYGILMNVNSIDEMWKFIDNALEVCEQILKGNPGEFDAITCILKLYNKLRKAKWNKI